jgi:hypothetical protein
MNNIELVKQLPLTSINIIKGKKEYLINFLNEMIDNGYFMADYDEVSKHFAYNYTTLSENRAYLPIEFGKIKSKSEVLRFTYFLRDSKLIAQNLSSVWTNFSFKNIALQANSYSLAAYSYGRFPDLYKLVSDTNLSIILKKYYSEINKV